MKLKIFLITSAVGLTAPAFAQDRRNLSLTEVTALAVQNSNRLKISDARTLSAAANLREARDRKLPDVKISGSYLRLGSADVSLKNNANGGNSPNVNQALYGIANVSLPLYAGGRIKYGIESARYLEEAAKLDAVNDRRAIVYNAIAAYTNLYKANAVIPVIEENLNASRWRDTLLSRLEANGLLARNDRLKAALQTSNIELALLDAQNNAAIAGINMSLLLGLPEGTIIKVDSSFVYADRPLRNIADLEAIALRDRPDTKALELRRKAAGIALKSATADAYPTVALTGGYIAADIPKFLTITNAVNVGVGLQYNLASLWKTNTGAQRARAVQTELTASRAMLDDDIRLSLNTEFQNYLSAQKKITVYREAVIQAVENARITKNKYDNALATITELLDADVALLQTRLNVAAAEADASLAYNRLLEIAGISNF